MSGLLDAVNKAIDRGQCPYGCAQPEDGREAVLAVAKWFDDEGHGGIASRLRVEVDPPPPPTAEVVIRRAINAMGGVVGQGEPVPSKIAAALRDAGLLREPYTEQSESSWPPEPPPPLAPPERIRRP